MSTDKVAKIVYLDKDIANILKNISDTCKCSETAIIRAAVKSYIGIYTMFLVK